MQAVRTVKSTDRVSFDETFKTFKLYAGNSLYSFCITPELTLEHLYWGPKLQDGYDLRYLGESARMAHFDTVETTPHSFEGKIVLEAETLEEIEKTWKENRHWNSQSTDEADYVQRRRLENYSWRIMSKVTQAELRANRVAGEKMRRKSLSVSFDLSDAQAVASAAAEGVVPERSSPGGNNSSTATRRRSISHPTAKIDPLVDLADLNAMSKLISDVPTSPSRRFFEGLASDRSQVRRHTRQTFDRKLGKIGKSTLCVEYSDHGTGDFRTPSLIVVDNYNGSAISPLRYRSHKIFKGKLPMYTDNMPAIRCMTDSEASTLVVTLIDAQTGLEVDLIYGKLCLDILLFLVVTDTYTNK